MLQAGAGSAVSNPADESGCRTLRRGLGFAEVECGGLLRRRFGGVKLWRWWCMMRRSLVVRSNHEVGGWCWFERLTDRDMLRLWGYPV